MVLTVFGSIPRRSCSNCTAIGVVDIGDIQSEPNAWQALDVSITRIGVLTDPNMPITGSFVSDVLAAASTIAKQIEVLSASSGGDIDMVFASFAQKPVDALLIAPAILFTSRSVQLSTLAAYHRVPAIFFRREAVEVGGLMSYGTSFTEGYRQMGAYVGQILKGEKPSNLPVLQPTKFELVINMKTAKALGLTVPSGMLAIADEVIE